MRTFSLVEGTSDKFWNIDLDGTSVTVHYGRSGTKGQTKTTEYATSAKAQAEADKLVASKVKKGYVEGAEGGSIPPVAPTAKADPPAVRTADDAPAPPADRQASPAAADDQVWDSGMDMELLLADAELAVVSGADEQPADLRDVPLDKRAARDWVNANTFSWSQYGSDLVFLGLPFDGLPSPDVAVWWLRFGLRRGNKTMQYPMTGTLRERLAFADRIEDGIEDLRSLPAAWFDLPPAVLAASFTALLGTEAALTALATGRYTYDEARDSAVLGMRAFLSGAGYELPPQPMPDRTLSPDDVEQMRVEHELREAAVNGGEDDIRTALAAYRAGAAHHWSAPLVLAAVAGLSDEDERWALLEPDGFARDPDLVRTWIAVTGVLGIPAVLAALNGEYVDKQCAIGIAKALASAMSGPGAVPVMLTVAADRRTGQVGLEWLKAHPRTVAVSDASVTPTQRELLRGVVRELRAQDPTVFGEVANPAVAQILAELAEEAAMPTIGIADAPEWMLAAAGLEAEAELADGPIKISPKIPSWAEPEALPPIVVDGTRFDPELTGAVVASALLGANEETRAARPLVAAVRERMLPKDRDALAVPLLRAFLANGGKPADRAWFLAAGFLGSDGFVQELTPMVREWPGQSQHQRAVLGLEVLAATGTDSALQSISGIANKSKFKGVQAAAREALAKLAAVRGLTVEQLEDRVVPDAGLDARGTRAFSYGPRAFRVTLSPQGKAVIRDLDADGRPTGKPRTALPAPNSKDDAELAKTAKADFSVLRKQLTEVAKVQTARLENAIVTGRAWSAGEHRDLVVGHPVLNSLIRPLVWQVLVDGQRAALVRATEDHEYVTVDEDPYDVPEEASVTLAHPLHLTPAERDAWRAHLVDYDLVAPLEQLDRPTYGLPDGQSGTRLSGLPAGSVNPGTLVSTLERMGWRRGIPADAGVVSYLSLPFETLDRVAVLSISDGLWTGMIHESGPQRLESLILGRLEAVHDLWYVDEGDASWLDWSTADPILVSEVRRAVAALAERAE